MHPPLTFIVLHAQATAKLAKHVRGRASFASRTLSATADAEARMRTLSELTMLEDDAGHGGEEASSATPPAATDTADATGSRSVHIVVRDMDNEA